jgi:hypothetical protein
MTLSPDKTVSYPLALLAIIWLFVMGHLSGPRRSAPTTPAPATPITLKRTRSQALKAFAGLTHKPQCALCARDTVQPKAPPPTRPDPLPPTSTDVPGRSTRPGPFVRTAIVTIVAGWDCTTCRPMGILVAVRGGSSTASAATGTFRSIMAPFFMASRRRWS